jgi:hypothetical protein
MTGLKDLCTPAYVYLVISVISLFILTLQNMGHDNKYCIGHYMCDVGNTYVIFVIKILHILFWTWLLNVICRGGATNFAWLLVLVPFILMFVMVGAFMISSASNIVIV